LRTPGESRQKNKENTMGLFNWFRSNKQEASDGSSSAEGKGIEAVYSFLQTDFEPKGYNDALINPDQSNKADGIRMIRSHLSIILDKSMNHYEKLIRDLDYHVKSRSDAGLVDLVEELKA